MMNLLLYLPILQGATDPATNQSLFNNKTIMNVGMIVLVFVIMYFLIIRPQRKKQKETENMLSAIKKGDKVTSIGGIKGIVHLVKEDTIVVKVDDSTKLEFSKNAIGSVDLPKDQTSATGDDEKPRLFGRKKSE